MALIIAQDSDQVRSFARRLLDAADRAEDVETTKTNLGGGLIGYVVSDELAARAGFPLDDDSPDTDTDVVIGTGGQGGTGIDSGGANGDSGADVTEGAGNGDAPAPVEPPARNASRAKWTEFLDAQEPPIAYEAGATRDELVALWDEHTSK